MRINVELKDLRSGARLGKLARTMGWNERETLGALVQFWGSTQDAEIVETTQDRLMTLIILDMDSDQQAEKFIAALIVAQLVTKNGETLHIKGNEEHVERLLDYRNRASKGGLAKKKNLNGFVSPGLATAKPQASPVVAPSCPPLLLSSFSISPSDLIIPNDLSPPPPEEPPGWVAESEHEAPPSPEELGPPASADEPRRVKSKAKKPPHPRAKPMRDLWCELFRSKAGVEFTDFGVPFNATIASLCKRLEGIPGDDERVIRAFFASTDEWITKTQRWSWRALPSRVDALRQEGIKRPSSKLEKLRAEIEKEDRRMRDMLAMPEEAAES